MPFAILIGAHERDNFGDISSSAVTAKMLRPISILKAGMMSSDMRAAGGELVVATGALKRSLEKLPPVCATVYFGGETLACDACSGLSMNLSEGDANRFLQMPPEMRARAIRGMAMQSAESLAYVQRAGDIFPDQSIDTPLIYHSVGGTALSQVTKDTKLRDSLQSSLRKATYVSVRDRRTQVQLAELFGIRAELSPDASFALKRVLGNEIAGASYLEPVRQVKALVPYVVFQSNTQFLSSAGLSDAAERIAEMADRIQTAVVLQPTGTASSHDSMSQLATLGTLITARYPHIRTYLQRNRNFLVQIAVIANALAWIGTSLHGRIAAIAMRVPAVNFENSKVKAMVETWEEQDSLPYEVTWDGLTDATLTALSAHSGRLESLACRLEEAAMESLTKVRELALSGAATDPGWADACMQQALLASLFEENRTLRQENLTLLSELARQSEDSAVDTLLEKLKRARQANDALQRSTSWRMTAPLRAIGRPIAVGRRFLNESIRSRLGYANVAPSDAPFQPGEFSKLVP
jgi:Polysaccharide pyruvyl transferase